MSYKNKDKKPIFSVTIKDCEIQPFKASGPGGQNKNKNATAIRIIHRESGAVGECKEYKSQMQNKKIAFRRMGDTQKFKSWANIKAAKILGKESIEETVERMMEQRNLKIEIRKDDRWVLDEEDN